MATLIGYDANGTDGTDPSLITAIYRVGGRIIRVPANLTAPEIKAYVVAQYNITAAEYDALSQLETTLDSLDFSTITGLSDTSTNAELVAAIQTLAQVVRELTRQARFMLRQE